MGAQRERIQVAPDILYMPDHTGADQTSRGYLAADPSNANP